MTTRIGLVHALYESMAPLEQVFAQRWPQAEIVHLYDGSLYADYRRHGEVTPQIDQRVASLIHHSAQTGAEGILFSGSLFGPAVETARRDLDIPVLTAYEAMIEAACRCGTHLVALATVADTLVALQTELMRYAEVAGVSCSVRLQHVPGALEALQSGDRQEHDRRVANCAAQFVDCDALLLAQHSMGPACRSIPAVPGRSVLTSPETAIAKLKHQLRPLPFPQQGP